MYAQCPACKGQHKIRTEHLRAKRGMLKCKRCGVIFDALETISDQPLRKRQGNPIPDKESVAKKSTGLWSGGFVFGLFLLIGQFAYFESYNLSQKPAFRSSLMDFCKTIDCSLPDYKNAEEISILKGTLEAGDAGSYRFKAFVVNQADFEQPYPNVRLTLLNFTGDAFAERTFTAAEYNPLPAKLASEESAEISFDIAAPAQKIGGYSFKLL